MAMVANDPKAAKRMGIPQSVGEEFMKADKGKKFAKGGYAAGGCATKADAKSIAKKEVKGHEKSMHGMKKGGITEKGTGEKYASKAAMMRHEKKESKAEEAKEHGMKKGGSVKKYAAGGMTESSKKPSKKAEKNVDEMLYEARNAGKKQVKDVPEDDMPPKDSKGNYIKPRPYKSGGMCGTKKYARGGGIEIRGKTRGKII